MGVPGGEARSISERIRDRILRLRARGLGSQTIANQANAWPVPDRPGGGRWWASTVRAVLMHDGAPDPAEGLRAPNEFLREVKGITRLSPSSYRYGSQRTGRTPERLWSTSDRAGPSVP